MDGWIIECNPLSYFAFKVKNFLQTTGLPKPNGLLKVSASSMPVPWPGYFFVIIEIYQWSAGHGIGKVTIVAHYRTKFTHAGPLKTIYLEINICYLVKTVFT